jgi:hypothetical protein
MPNAVQSEISVVNTIFKITDKQYFAASSESDSWRRRRSSVFLNLREKHGWTYGAY